MTLSSGTSVGHYRLIQKLTKIAPLSHDEKQALNTLPLVARSFGANQEVVHDRERSDRCCLVVEGFVHRFKQLGHGRRQTLSLHIPGDIPDVQSLHLNVMDYTLGTLTPCTLAFVSHQEMLSLMGEFPGLATAFWRDTLIDAAVFREWIINVGSRPGPQRIAHLFCELFYRLASVGLAQDDGCEMPLTQVTLGEAAGLSTVHVNRMMQDLRARGLVVTRSNFLHIPDWKALQAFADFDSSYLRAQDMGPV